MAVVPVAAVAVRPLDAITAVLVVALGVAPAVAVAVVSAVFVSPSCGCDTPTNASVCNGFGGVCVVLVCYLTG